MHSFIRCLSCFCINSCVFMMFPDHLPESCLLASCVCLNTNAAKFVVNIALDCQKVCNHQCSLFTRKPTLFLTIHTNKPVNPLLTFNLISPDVFLYNLSASYSEIQSAGEILVSAPDMPWLPMRTTLFTLSATHEWFILGGLRKANIL